jgi:8-oxo-dGTP pyrophosphatase MutT (NUDIX family)
MKQAPRPAATIVLLRPGPQGPEVLMLRRTQSAAFLGGAYGFPGGSLDAADADPAVLARVTGKTEEEANAKMKLAAGSALAYFVAAVRECFEEAGVLLATTAQGGHLSAERVQALMRHRNAPFNAFLAEEDLYVPAGDLAYYGHWITAPGRSRRFDTTPLAARERADVRLRRWQPQRVHGEFDARVEIPSLGRLDAVLDLALFLEDLLHLLRRHLLTELRVDFVVAVQQVADLRHTLFDIPENRLRRIQLRFLLEKSDADASGRKRLTDEVLILPRHDPQQRALAGSVQAEDADLRAGQELQPDVLENDVVGLVDLP